MDAMESFGKEDAVESFDAMPSLGAMVFANAPLETKIKFIRELCNDPNIAHLHFESNLTGTANDPFADEVVILSYKNKNLDRNENITQCLSYDKILSFMSKGCDSGQVLLRKDVIKARNIMLDIWKRATGGQNESKDEGWTIIWKEPGNWMFPFDTKIKVLSDLMSPGPKILKICCSDPNLDDKSKELLFWDIVFNDHCYDVFAQCWLV
jgi:hypothetical protein